MHEQRLGEARHAHEKRVPAGEDAGEQLFDDLVLADDHPGQLGPDAAIEFAKLVDGLDVGILGDRTGGFFLHRCGPGSRLALVPLACGG